MKAMILGASGNYGAKIAKLLGRGDTVSSIILTARKVENVAEIAREIGTKAVPVALDVTDETSLANAFSSVDLVINCVGHYHLHLEKSVRAAIQSRTHHVDLSEFCKLAKKIHSLSDAAKQADISVIHGAGSTPGVTSLLGLHAARQLDHVERVHGGFFVSTAAYFPSPDSFAGLAADRSNSAVQDTIIALAETPACVFRNGAVTETEVYSPGPLLPLPSGRDLQVYEQAMSFALTLPKVLPDLGYASGCMTFVPDDVMQILKRQGKRVAAGEMTYDAAFNDVAKEVCDNWEQVTALPEGVPAYAQWGFAVGRKDGKGASCAAYLNKPLSTEAAAAAAILRIGQGQLQERGVFSFEMVFDPMTFFNDVSMLQYGLPLQPEDISFVMKD